MKVTGLFAGIGGIEQGLGDRHEPLLLCEIEPTAQAVLRAHFPDAPLWGDVRTLRSLPGATEVLTAGFPCQDLSQAGRTAGIAGERSGLVSHLFRLLESRLKNLTWVVIENVRNMLSLDRGKAMAYLVDELEALGFSWAYRLVDTRAFGLPQRRQRVLLVASRTEDPRPVLLGEDAGEPSGDRYRDDAFGFYWTEGLRGLGWAQDAVPTLKGGSTIGIPSPPAIWVPQAEDGMRIVTPDIDDAERLQGFPAGWTDPVGTPRRGPRWRMVGNAVSVPVARWLGDRLQRPGNHAPGADPLLADDRWPRAAWGAPGGPRRESLVSMWPRHEGYQHLGDMLRLDLLQPLSSKASAGFLGRLERGYLRTMEEFRRDLKSHVETMRGSVGSRPEDSVRFPTLWPREATGSRSSTPTFLSGKR
jgi:DNA (cytosine-5)-methyltransferase 1